MKSKIMNIILIICISFITILSSGFTPTQTQVTASATSKTSSSYDTVFMHTPNGACSVNDYTLVLDTFTNSILKFDDGKIVQGEKATANSYDLQPWSLLQGTWKCARAKGTGVMASRYRRSAALCPRQREPQNLRPDV